MKRNKDDFFVQMNNYKTSTKGFDAICLTIAIISLVIAYIVGIFAVSNKTQSNNALIGVIICLVITSLMFLFILLTAFAKNGIRFLAGNFLAGLKCFAIVLLPVYIFLIILYIVLPNWREFLRSIFTVITTIGGAILTVMGIHYTLAKQQQSKNEEKNLIFEICNNAELNNYSLSNSIGDKTIQINLKNISNNFGYLTGIYRICGCDAHQIGDNLPYLPIKPNSGYSITNIKTNLGDDQLIVVYKDIGENYYYLLITSNNEYIESSGKCDMDFLRWRLYNTIKSEKRIKRKSKQSFELSTATNSLPIDDSPIINEKEKTKPNHTQRENGFDLILSPNGEVLTDKVLLNKLRKERTKLSKEKQVKAYMIFNNQQLVAMATYKPHDELSFISIYGLGKKKYDLYGKIFLPLIEEHTKTQS